MLKNIDAKRREIEKKRRKLSRAQGFLLGITAGYVVGRHIVPVMKEKCCVSIIAEDMDKLKCKTNDFFCQMKAGKTDFYDESLFEDEAVDELLDEEMDIEDTLEDTLDDSDQADTEEEAVAEVVDEEADK